VQHNRLSQVKSEPIPTRNDAPVKIVVSNSFEADVMHERCPLRARERPVRIPPLMAALACSRGVLLEFYAPWCSHCQEFAPIYSRFAEKVKPAAASQLTTVHAARCILPSACCTLYSYVRKFCCASPRNVCACLFVLVRLRVRACARVRAAGCVVHACVFVRAGAKGTRQAAKASMAVVVAKIDAAANNVDELHPKARLLPPAHARVPRSTRPSNGYSRRTRWYSRGLRGMRRGGAQWRR
jgi:thiol-disulfide isomerase/thioredoxin